MPFLKRRGRFVSCYLFSNNGIVLIALFNVSLESSSHSFSLSWRIQARTILLSLLWKLVVQFRQYVEEVGKNILFINAHELNTDQCEKYCC